MQTSRKLAEIHNEAISCFNDIQASVKDERSQCRLDRRFCTIAGAQWEGRLGDQYENKVKFEVNKIHMSVLRIINEYRNSRIAVDFVSKTGEQDELADSLDELLRADEEASNAQEAYDNAFEEGTIGGLGGWRWLTCYEDEDDDDNDHLVLRVEPINDADSSIYFDLNAKRQDKADAEKCYVLTAIPRKTYLNTYDDDPTSWPQDLDKTRFDWQTPDVVYVAEYYCIEYIPEDIIIFEGLDGEEERFSENELKEDPQLLESIYAAGAMQVDTKTVNRRKVHKYIMSGGKILEDCGYIAGKNIPIVPMYGKRWFVDNVERCMGHVRLAKDVQRLKNMQLSKLGEISAFSSVEKPILIPEQIAGLETMWADDNIKNYPYLLLNPITDQNGNTQPAGPAAYTKSPPIPPAMAALLQITEQDMQDLLGNQQAAEEMRPNMSGKAIELIQNKLDMQSFIYMSNMAKAMKRSGEIWLSMAKEVYYETGRKLKTLSRDKDVGSFELMKPVENPETKAIEYKNDLSKANFDIIVDVGPSTSTKRAATVKALTGLIQMTGDAETQAVLTSMAILNMEGEGLAEIKNYFRNKLLRMGVIKPTEEEAQKLNQEMMAQQNRGPSPQEQYMQALAAESTAKAQKAQADSIKTRADTMKTIADTEKIKAETVETLSSVDQSERQEVVSTIEKLQQAAAQPQVQLMGE